MLARTAAYTDCTHAPLGMATPMHDIGKIGVTDSVLKKPGPLTPEERAVMNRHAQIHATQMFELRDHIDGHRPQFSAPLDDETLPLLGE